MFSLLHPDGINGLVLDAELVAVDRSEGKVRLRAFQELSTRARGGVTSDQVRDPPALSSLPAIMHSVLHPASLTTSWTLLGDVGQPDFKRWAHAPPLLSCSQ